MAYYAAFVLRSALHMRPAQHDPAHQPRLAVIVPARNEAPSIAACLESLANQAYPHYEVILVDDHSTDTTIEAAQDALRRHASPTPPVRILPLPPGQQGKKAALAHGIAHAHAEIVVQTDADCTHPPGWLAGMAAHFAAPGVDMVAGPVRLTHPPGGYQAATAFQAFEYAGLMGLTWGNIAAGTPNMCNGANLAFRKAAFVAAGGYSGIDHVASGDDELLMHKLHLAGHGIAFAAHPQAVVRTHAQATWRDFWRQRIRWVSKAKHYRRRRINATQTISYAAFAGLPMMGLFACLSNTYACHLALGVLLKCAADALLMHRALRLLQTPGLWWHFAPMQAAYPAYVIAIGLLGNLAPDYAWKGRRVA